MLGAMKICISSVIPGHFDMSESFWNYKGLSILFLKILDAIWRVAKVSKREAFSDSSLHRISEFK